MKSRKLKSAARALPQSRDEVAALIGQIGEDERALCLIEVELNEKIAALRAGYEERADPLRQRIAASQSAVQSYCEANRASLTDGGKVKTHRFTTGDVAWRTRPPAVRVTAEADCIARLQESGRGRFVRVRQEINREAVLAEREAVEDIPQIRVVQSEDFIVTPHQIELAPGADSDG